MSTFDTQIENRNKNIATGVLSLFVAIFLLSLLFGSRTTALVSEFGPFVVFGSLINVIICWRRAVKADSALVRRATPVEDRLVELERLKRRDMVTPEEYAAKRQEILKDL